MNMQVIHNCVLVSTHQQFYEHCLKTLFCLFTPYNNHALYGHAFTQARFLKRGMGVKALTFTISV